ncbi:MAG: GxGYxYP domain-containing protein [Armatimonadota bacterium]
MPAWKSCYTSFLILLIQFFICVFSFAEIIDLPKLPVINGFTDGVYNVDEWRYFNVGGAKGQLKAVDSSDDGSMSIELSRNSASGDTGIDRLGHLIPVKPGYRYTLTVWARSTSGSSIHLTMAAHKTNGDWLELQTEKVYKLNHKSRPYQIEYSLPAGASRLNLGIHVKKTGSIIIEKCSLKETKMSLKITYPANETIDSFTPTVAFADAPHTAYEVNISDNDGTVFSSGKIDGTEYTIKCDAVTLKPEHSYKVKVRVQNDGSWSEYTAPSSFITPSTPVVKIVSPVEADAFRGSTKTVKWQAESPKGITSQRIIIDDGSPIDLKPDVRSYNLVGLNEGVHSIRLIVTAPEGTSYDKSKFYVWITPAPEGILYVYDIGYVLKNSVDSVEGRKRRFDTEFAIATLQGLVNRTGPNLYLKLNKDDDLWLSRLREPDNWLAKKTIVTIPDLQTLFSTFSNQYKGAVLWDPDVYATSNVATTVAGADDLIPVLYDTDPESMHSQLIAGVPNIPVKVNLVGRFTGTGTIWDTNIASTGSRKNDAYVWARTKYLETGKSNPSLLQYVIDAYWIYKKATGLDDASRAMCDYTIRNKGFAFDLGVWDDEKPVDDPDQRLGLDLETHKSILAEAAKRAPGMIQYLGFVPWPAKYSNSDGAGGTHGPVDSEWEQVRLLSYYNAYMEPDCPPQLPNASIHSQFPLPDRLTQNAKLSRTELRKLGYIDSGNNVSALNFLNLYMGDYDGSTWMDRLVKWDDLNRGKYPTSWAFNPNLLQVSASIYEYYNRTKTVNDSFIAGDCGSGYVNPSRVLNDRISGLPSGEDKWVQHNLKYFRLTNTKVTGFLINGTAGPLGEDVDKMYAKFSVDGTFSWASWYPQGHHVTGSMPSVVMEDDLSHDVSKDIESISKLGTIGGPKFLTHRTILVTPTYVKDLFEGLVSKYDKLPWAFVDSRTQTALVGASLGKIPDGRATYTFDTIPNRAACGGSLDVSVGVRNDGWITWKSTGSKAVRLVITWMKDHKVADTLSMPLHRDVESGRGVIMPIRLTVPATPGSYTVTYEMFRGNSSFSSLGDYAWEKNVEVKP